MKKKDEFSCESPIQVDFDRKVNYDEDGNEFITYVEVDYPTLQQSLGSVEHWKLSALLSAGVNPNFSIHTGLNTRLEGLGVIENAAAMAEKIIAETDSNNE